MNQSGDAAEQIVRLSLEGIEVAARITGSAAKEIAIFLVAALKNKDSKLKTKGKARMESMLKSGKPLEIFSVKESDLRKFAQGAKQYGIVYCALRNKKAVPDGLCDILVKADDAPKISRLVERFKFATVDRAKIASEIVKSKAAKAVDAAPAAPDKNDTEKLLDELLVKSDGRAVDVGQATKDIDRQIDRDSSLSTVNSQLSTVEVNPKMAKTEKSRLSEPISERKSRTAEGTLNDRSSVRKEIREIKAARQSEKEVDTPKRGDKAKPGKPTGDRTTTHTQPQAGGKSKTRKPKVR